MEISSQENVDISFQKDDLYRRNRRLICFDMDSTLIKTEVIDELADRAGVGDEVRKITESAMRGEIDFSESSKCVNFRLKNYQMLSNTLFLIKSLMRRTQSIL